MTDVPNQTTQPAPKKGWRWWHIALALLVLAVGLSLIGESPDLKLSITGEGQLRIQNVGHKGLDITNVRINDQPDCKVLTSLNIREPDAKAWPIHVDVGGYVGIITFCPVVRVAVDTSAGSTSFQIK